MAEKLNFSTSNYKKTAINKNYSNYINNNTKEDAFLLCIKGLPFHDLDNLCILLHKYFKSLENPIILSYDECYLLTQGKSNTKINFDENIKYLLFNLAYQCIYSKKDLGSNTIMEGKINTSSWISHSLYQGIVASNLASYLNLDSNTAQKLGILHDIGRKQDHNFNHTIKGYEMLIDEGFIEEATICLTHSFLADITKNTFKGGRCANCDPALNGFYIDENGNPNWIEGSIKDDVTEFLENYNYNDYDLIVCMSDLMATAKGITTPYERVNDIATRKKIDPKNRNYFKILFINMMIYFIQKINHVNLKKLELNINITNEEIDSIFFHVSNMFFELYDSIEKNQTQKKVL